jgi:two-component system, repressor protein LuxO
VAAKGSILIVEDSTSLQETYRLLLEELGYNVTLAGTGQEALTLLASAPRDCMLLDLKLPDINGMDILQEVRQWQVAPAIVVITANASLNMAVEAVRLGAFDYLVKPFAPARLATTIANALANTQLKREVETFRRTVEPGGLEGFIGRSLPMQRVYRIIEAAARSSASVFITGESGTGKELAAQALHQLSPRAAKRFVALNCGAIPRDLLESTIFGHVKGAFTGAATDQEGAAARAEGGTLFLDEIGEMDMALQTKLLRFIQTSAYERVGDGRSRQGDIRFVAATNRDPQQAVREGRLREDLFYRLYVVPLEMPPLRVRGEDILLLAHKFMRDIAAREGSTFKSISPQAEAMLLAYHWPGNVRQMQNVIHSAMIMHQGTVLTDEMLPISLADGMPVRVVAPPAVLPAVPPAWQQPAPAAEDQDILKLAEMERLYVERAIRLCDGNIQLAARRLGISASTIYRKKEAWDQGVQPADG